MMNKKKIEQDNNLIIDSVYATLERALRKQDVYEVTVIDDEGNYTERMTREQHLEFLIECAIEELQEHNYFYEKEGIDKYE